MAPHQRGEVVGNRGAAEEKKNRKQRLHAAWPKGKRGYASNGM